MAGCPSVLASLCRLERLSMECECSIIQVLTFLSGTTSCTIRPRTLSFYFTISSLSAKRNGYIVLEVRFIHVSRKRTLLLTMTISGVFVVRIRRCLRHQPVPRREVQLKLICLDILPWPRLDLELPRAGVLDRHGEPKLHVCRDRWGHSSSRRMHRCHQDRSQSFV